MSDILATPDPGNRPHPRQNGHRANLLVEDLHPHEVQDCELTAELTAEVAELETMLAEESLLPGFECLTWADLARAALPPCPDWCVHTDEHDTDTDADPDTSEHRGVRHSIVLAQGGASFGDHDPNATLSIQLEQDHDQDSAPVIVLELTINGIPHEAYLGNREALALRDTLTRLLNDAGH